MQQPCSPLIPLDADRLQRQMQRPLMQGDDVVANATLSSVTVTPAMTSSSTPRPFSSSTHPLTAYDSLSLLSPTTTTTMTTTTATTTGASAAVSDTIGINQGPMRQVHSTTKRPVADYHDTTAVIDTSSFHQRQQNDGSSSSVINHGNITVRPTQLTVIQQQQQQPRFLIQQPSPQHNDMIFQNTINVTNWQNDEQKAWQNGSFSNMSSHQNHVGITYNHNNNNSAPFNPSQQHAIMINDDIQRKVEFMPSTPTLTQQQSLLQRQQSSLVVHEPSSLTSAHYHNELYDNDSNSNAGSKRALLAGCTLLVVGYEEFETEINHDWRCVVQQHGAQLVRHLDANVTHVVSDSTAYPVVQRALELQKRCVTAQWLNDCIQACRLVVPFQIVHFPSPYLPNNGPCKNKTFAMSGFNATERLYIRQMAAAVGASCTPYLSRHSALLIAKCLQGDKILKAIEWKIPIVNINWLMELYVGKRQVLQNLNSARYHQFLTKEALTIVHLDVFRIDPNVAPFSILLSSWCQPISVNPNCWQMADEMSMKCHEDCSKCAFRRTSRPSTPVIDRRLTTSERQTGKGDLFFNSNVKVTFSGLLRIDVERLSEKALCMGWSLELNVKQCTHLIAVDLKRTLKLLEAVACGCPIVLPKWIEDSYKRGHVLDCAQYFVKDDESEMNFGFNLKLSIVRATSRPLFQDLLFFVTPSVYPSCSTLINLIELCGGTVLHHAPEASKVVELLQNDVTFVVISCDEDLVMCLHIHQPGVAVYTVEFILTSVLRQEIDFESFRLNSFFR